MPEQSRPKSGGAAVSLSMGELGPHLTLSPGRPMPTSVPNGILIHPTVWTEYPTLQTDRQTDRQERQDNSRTVP